MGRKGEMYGENRKNGVQGGQLILAHSPGGILARGQSHCIGLDRCVQIPHVVLPGAALGVYRGAAWGRRLEYIPVTLAA